jgi:hypothetical protein
MEMFLQSDAAGSFAFCSSLSLLYRRDKLRSCLASVVVKHIGTGMRVEFESASLLKTADRCMFMCLCDATTTVILAMILLYDVWISSCFILNLSDH